MLLTVSKRLEFSASRRLFRAEWPNEKNVAAFGPETNARYGTGRNYVAFFIFTGVVNPANGMLVNISEIKERVEKILHAGFDHKFLNEDHPHFREQPPTTENIARQLFVEVAPLFADLEARESLARIFRRAPDDVAAFKRTGKRSALWGGGLTAWPWTSLPRTSHLPH